MSNFRPKDLELIRANILANVVSNVDEVNDTNIGSVLDIFTLAVGNEIFQQYEELKNVYDGFNVNVAEGVDLNNLGTLIGVPRIVGSVSNGVVTFISNDVVNNNFTISSGTELSTAPALDSEALVFVTNENTVFQISSTLNTVFVDGILDYRLPQRLFVVNSFLVDGSPFSDYEIIDYNGLLPSNTGLTVVNEAVNTTGWSNEAGAANLTVNNSVSIRGGSSLNLIKTVTNTDSFGYTYDVSSSVSLDNNNDLMVSFLLSDTFKNTKFSKLIVRAGSGYDGGAGNTNNYFEWEFSNDDFVNDEFVRLFMSVSNASVVNVPDVQDIDFLQVFVETLNDSNTVSAGDCVMDFWFAGQTSFYNGSLIRIDNANKPSNNDAMVVVVNNLSVDVPVVSLEIGSDKNVGVGNINFLRSNVPGINRVFNFESFVNGLDVETDVSYRERLISGSYVSSVGSVKAIVENLKTLSFVQDALVIDLPLDEKNDEALVYNDSTKENELVNKLPVVNSLVISDTIGGIADYVLNTDYQIVNSNVIDWDIGGTTPSDGATFYVTYDFERIGYFKVVVVGANGLLTSSQLQQVIDRVDDIISPGVVSIVNQASYVQVVVDMSLSVDSSFDEEIVKNEVNNSLNVYIANLNIATDVRISRLIDVIMGVDGVLDVGSVEINGQGNNLVVGAEEKAVLNTVNFN